MKGPWRYEDPFRCKWDHAQSAEQIFWGPSQGEVDGTQEVLFNGVIWQFVPFLFAQDAGEITGISIIGQNNGGAGATVDFGWGIWIPDDPVAQSGKLGTLLASGTAQTTDNYNGEVVLASGLNVQMSHNMVWIGIGSGAQAYYLQKRQSAGPVPGLPGNSTNSVISYTAVSVGTAAPAQGKDLYPQGVLPSIFCKWRPR